MKTTGAFLLFVLFQVVFFEVWAVWHRRVTISEWLQWFGHLNPAVTVLVGLVVGAILSHLYWPVK